MKPHIVASRWYDGNWIWTVYSSRRYAHLRCFPMSPACITPSEAYKLYLRNQRNEAEHLSKRAAVISTFKKRGT